MAALWWQGPCECHACGYQARLVSLIADDRTEPPFPIECPKCHNYSLVILDETTSL